jgi:hypothetical protein
MNGVTREDRIKIEYVRGSIVVGSIVENMKENRLKWFGYVMRQEETNTVRMVMKINVEGKKEKPKKKNN